MGKKIAIGLVVFLLLLILAFIINDVMVDIPTDPIESNLSGSAAENID
jgi:hypothetical protein